MKTALWLFASLTFADAACHLAACATGAAMLRRVTKVLFMPLLTAVYCLASKQTIPLVVAAMLLGWLGDVLLLGSRHLPAFACGAASFALGHACYVAAVTAQTQAAADGAGSLLWLLCLLALTVPVVMSVMLRRQLRENLIFVAALPVYLLLLTLLCTASLVSLLLIQSVAAGLLLLGALLFLFSDLRLILLYFRREPAASCGDFGVMLTYLLAQLLIMLGFCL